MFRKLSFIIFFLAAATLARLSIAQSMVPFEQIVPASAKGFFSIPDIISLETNWNRCELSRLFEDPAIKPFVQDLCERANQQLEDAGIQFGLTVEDLREVCSGEAAIAFLQPNDPKQRHAMLVLIDTAGKASEADALVERIEANMKARDISARKATIGEVPTSIYTVPVKDRMYTSLEAVLIHHENYLVVTDHIQVAQQVVANLLDPGTDALASVPGFSACMTRVLSEVDNRQPDLRWYVEPLGYAELARDFSVRKKRRRTDVLKAMRNQGFDAVQGMGGIVNFAVGNHEVVQHAYAYAPAVREAGEAKYQKAAGMLAYPIVDSLEVQDWIPAHVNSYVTARWDIPKAFKHVGALVDEVAGEPGFFDDLLESLKNDPTGPQIDLNKEIVAYLGNRVTIITNTIKPVTISSERLLIAIELTDAEQMTRSLEKMFANDPVAERLEFDGHVIWEIINEDDDLGVVKIEGLEGFGDLEGFGGDEDNGDNADEEEPFLANAALSVVKGHLVIASHSDFVREMVTFSRGDNTLDKDSDYQLMRQQLTLIGDTGSGGRLFSRSDREFEASYELIRAGKMPESEGLIGRLLNRVLSTGERGVVRAQRVDGAKMPAYEVVQKYLGPLGMFIRTEDDGWYVSGIGLKRETDELQGSRPALTTAAAEGQRQEN